LTAPELKTNAVQLNIDIAPNELDLNADPKMIEQILINILQNASHALAETERPQIWLSARLNRRGRTIIEIADNGSGIEPEVMQKIFVPFYTTKREGSGVGLALTRQIMIAHNGAVTVQDREGGGTVFALIF